MIAASIFDHPGILLLIIFVTLIRWLVSKAKSQTQTPQNPVPPSRPIPRGGETQTEEERVRRFLEALGQPAGTTPPPKVVPRRRQVRPDIFSPLPPLKTKPPPLPEIAAAPPPLPIETVRATRTTSGQGSFEVHDIAHQTSSEPVAERRRVAGSRIKLGTRQDLRTAIVLREIFGPPRSLQPFDLTN